MTVNPPGPRVLYYHPEDVTPNWKLTLQKIVEILAQLLVPFAMTWIAFLVLPMPLVPLVAIASAFTTAFLFAPRKTELKAVPYEEIHPPALPLLPGATKGIINGGNNCWLNSLLQVMRCDEGWMQWLRNTPDGLVNRWANLLPLNILFPDAPAVPATLIPLLPDRPRNFNPMTAREWTSWRRAGDTRILNWLRMIPEAANLPLTLFNDPMPERNRIVEKLRQVAEREQMTAAEKANLAAKIGAMQAGLRMLREPNPQVNRLPIAERAIFREQLQEVQRIRALPPGEKQQLQRYLTMLRSMEVVNRVNGAQCLTTMRDFYRNYEAGIPVRSQEIRLCLSTLLNTIRPDIGQQSDPTEAYTALIDLFPPELKTEREIRKIYKTRGLPDIAGGPIRTERQSSNGIIPLELMGNCPRVSDMLHHFSDKPAGDDEPARLADVNGQNHMYSLEREQFQFVRAPASLWLHLKRFTNEVPWSFLHSIFPCCFSIPKAEPTKITRHIDLSEEIEIQTIEEGAARYRLDGFGVHLGSSQHGGHYISYRREGDVWYEMNDNHVRRIDGKELERAKAQAYFTHHSRIP